METKKCNNCHNIFPKTKDYFFIKITKKDSKTGIRLKLKK